ncbi:hypothetical protein COTS27_01461 [Spirochaetota bacterium]|nr:hypothetical protein COTS27_01461 [Spirochaetota bacterium]
MNSAAGEPSTSLISPLLIKNLTKNSVKNPIKNLTKNPIKNITAYNLINLIKSRTHCNEIISNAA